MRILTNFFLLFFLILSSCNKKIYHSKIGYINSRNENAVTEIDSVSKKWNDLLIENKIVAKLNRFEIRNDFDSINRKKYYYLIGFSKNDSVKVATLVIKKNKKFYFYNDSNVLVICHNCADSYPKMQFDEWGWSCETKNLIECKKSVVVSY